MDFNKLIHAVTYWLSYQDRIGRRFFIEESSLRYPVADFLTGTRIAMKEIELEHNHPRLERRKIDLVTLGQETNEIEIALEFKIAKPESRKQIEKKRIFYDLMRLHLLAASGKVHCYFLIAGDFEQFVQSFRNISRSNKNSKKRRKLPEPTGFYTNWFSFSPYQPKVFEVKNAKATKYSSIYHSFLSEYNAVAGTPSLELPSQIKTTCMAISAFSMDYPTPYVGGIWKVE